MSNSVAKYDAQMTNSKRGFESLTRMTNILINNRDSTEMRRKKDKKVAKLFEDKLNVVKNETRDLMNLCTRKKKDID